jgi:group I intron endonuclease
MSYLIYKHTNKINGKSYIGLTQFNYANIRWQNGKGYAKHTQPCFRDAIKKYGWENFTHEILEDNIKTRAEANQREQYWIAYYHTYVKDPFCNGYNLTKGGDDHTYTARGVLQLSENKVILQRFDSLLLAENSTGIPAKNIYRACVKKLKSAGGYYWCYATDYDDYKIEKSKKLIAVQEIYQLDLQDNIVATYASMSEAVRMLGYNSCSKISMCCNNKRKTAYGYKWRYKNEERKNQN